MKSLLRSFLINAVVLFALSQTIEGIIFAKGMETLFLAAASLSLVHIFLQPILNILLLPINILTLGTFRWVVNVITFYLVTLIVPGFKIVGFHFAGLSYQVINLPPVDLGAFLGLIAFSFLLSFISGFFFWLVK